MEACGWNEYFAVHYGKFKLKNVSWFCLLRIFAFFGIYHALKYILEAIKQNKKRFYLLLFYWPSAIFFDVFNGPEVYSWQAVAGSWSCVLWTLGQTENDIRLDVKWRERVFVCVAPQLQLFVNDCPKGLFFFFPTRTNILFCKVSTYFG